MYTSSTNLTRHRKSAHEGEQFFCGVCDKAFGDQSNLKRHVNEVHLKKKPAKSTVNRKIKSQSKWEIISNGDSTQAGNESNYDDDDMSLDGCVDNVAQLTGNTNEMDFEKIDGFPNAEIESTKESFEYYCDECGLKYIKSTAKFCTKCGTRRHQ